MDELTKSIKEIGVSGARWIEENVDEQYRALGYLWRHLEDAERFLKLVVTNSLVSYQLSGKGEDWWWEFAEWFTENPGGEYDEFLASSRFNKRLLPVKLRRSRRFLEAVKNVHLLPYYTRMVELWKFIANIMGSPPTSKTIVFAVKMYGYAARIATGNFIPYPSEIPIPVDSRIKKLTERLGGKDPIAFWREVAKRSGVPPLHIDSILWPLLGNEELSKVYEEQFGEAGRRLAQLVL